MGVEASTRRARTEVSTVGTAVSYSVKVTRQPMAAGPQATEPSSAASVVETAMSKGALAMPAPVMVTARMLAPASS
jgi:hypothetical protein